MSHQQTASFDISLQQKQLQQQHALTTTPSSGDGGSSVHSHNNLPTSNFMLAPPQQQSHHTAQQAAPLSMQPVFFADQDCGGGGSSSMSHLEVFPFHQQTGVDGGFAGPQQQQVDLRQQPPPNPLAYLGQPTMSTLAAAFPAYLYQQQQLQMQQQLLVHQWQLQQQGLSAFSPAQNVLQQHPLQTYHQQLQQTLPAQQLQQQCESPSSLEQPNVSFSSSASAFRSAMVSPPLSVEMSDNNNDSGVVFDNDFSDAEHEALPIQLAEAGCLHGMNAQTGERSCFGVERFGANAKSGDTNTTSQQQNVPKKRGRPPNKRTPPQWLLREDVDNLLSIVRETAKSPFIDLICDMLADPEKHDYICLWVSDAKGLHVRKASPREWTIRRPIAFMRAVNARFASAPAKTYMQLNRALKVYEMDKDCGGRGYGRLLHKMPDRRNHFQFFPDSE